MIEISIIVPVYKVEKFLAECIDSILYQSFKDFELLLVDDGSPDRSGEICEEYAKSDSRIKVLHKNNGGLASARNFGLDSASGNYVIFVDSDDILADNALEILHNEIIENEADIVLGKIIRFADDTGSIRLYTRLDKRKAMSGQEALELLLAGSLLNITLCGSLFKREIWDNLRMPDGFICEDWFIMPHIYLQKNLLVVFTPNLVYMYRENAKSTMFSLYRRGNPQVIEVAEHVIQTIYNRDQSIYSRTLWSNLKRVWKYVGIIYSCKRVQEEAMFLEQVRDLLKHYWYDLKKSGRMSLLEKIGVWSFCFFPQLCSLLYKIK